MRGHLLILLVPVLSLCGATEYYVRPTEPTNTSCPAQPCLTLSQYTSDPDRYFKSNTVFKFLPGTHYMDRSVIIGNVHNLSLEGFSDESDEYPHLVAQLSCNTETRGCIPLHRRHFGDSRMCCAAVWLHDMYNVTVKGMRIMVQTSNKPISPISVVMLKNVSDITVQLIAIQSLTNHTTIGITIHDANSLHIHSSSATKCSFGLVFYNVTTTHINKVTAIYNEFRGLDLDTATDIHINSTTAAHNGKFGIYLSSMSNTYLTDMTVTHNHASGMYFNNMSVTRTTNLVVSHNRGQGMILHNMSNTSIANVTTTHNGFYGMSLEHMRNTHIANTVAKHNDWAGMSLLTCRSTFMTRTNATHNGNVLNSHVGVFDGQIVIASSVSTLIYNTSFSDVSTQSTTSAEDSTSPPAVIAVYQSALCVTHCDFTRNVISAIGAYASNITVSGDLTFSNNKAFIGAAFILIQDSILTSAINSHISFLSNHATDVGGVFYITKNSITLVSRSYYSRSTCFFNTEGSRSRTRFTFANNTARKGGDILYGGYVGLGMDGNWNCLNSFKKISNISQNGLPLISSDPSRVCLCNGTGQPDCHIVVDPTPLTVYPGQTISISAVVVGQDFGTVAGSVYAQFLQRRKPPPLESGQEVQRVTQHNCNMLHYTMFSQSEVTEAVLVLTPQDSYVSSFPSEDVDEYLNTEYSQKLQSLAYTSTPVYVNVSFLSCPPGFLLTSDSPFKCDCDTPLQQIEGIQCHIQEQTIGRSGLLWVGMKQDYNGTSETVAASESCPLDYCNKENITVTLKEPDPQCNYNHSGTLCGGCQPGLSLALGSAQCLRCSNQYLALLIPLILAGPVLVFSIKLLDLTISQGTLNGLIFYANVVKANEYIFFPSGQTNLLSVFIAWLNLDLGVETCLFEGLTAYSKTWLQFVFPFYIWSIAGLIIILARYSDRVARVMGNNSVPVLATLFLLSYAKLLRTIITALSYTLVYTSHGPKAVWTADGNVDYFGPKHAPLFATAVAVLLFLWLPYTLVLFLHMCNCHLIVRMLMKVKPFLDAHYGPLKHKHHYWFGTLLLMRAVILLISALVPADRSNILVLCVSLSAVVLTYFGNMVYRNLAVSMFDTFFFMNLALLGVANFFTTTAGGNMAVPTYTLIGVALVQFVGLVLFKLFSILRRSEKLMRCLHRGQPLEDDWELYEQAACQREMESDTEEQDSEGSGSIESLPTY